MALEWLKYTCDFIMLTFTKGIKQFRQIQKIIEWNKCNLRVSVMIEIFLKCTYYYPIR